MVEKVSSRQMIYLIVISRVVISITLMPSIRLGPANQDIWLIIIGSLFYTFVLNLPILFLLNRFRDISLMNYIEKIFGKFLGKIIGLIYVLHFITIAILFMYISIQTIRTLFLTMMPSFVTILLITITCIYISAKGLEVIGRLAEFVGPVIFIEVIILFILGIANIDLSILLPIYSDSTFSELNMGAIEFSLLFTDIFILTGVVSNLENKEEPNKIFFKSVMFSMMIVLVSVALTQTTLGIEQSKDSSFPFLAFIRLIDAHSILQRIESVFILLWMVAIIIRVTIYLYISAQGLKEVLNIKNRTNCVYIVGILVGAITYYLAEYSPQVETLGEFVILEHIYYFIFKTIIPLIGVIIYFFRRKTIEGKGLNS